MAKQKPPKFNTTKELRTWVRSIGKENIDLRTLKKAYGQIKKNK